MSQPIIFGCTHWIRRPTSVALLLRAYPGQWSAYHVLLSVCTVRCLSSCHQRSHCARSHVMSICRALVMWIVPLIHGHNGVLAPGQTLHCLWIICIIHLSFCIEYHWFSSCQFMIFSLLAHNVQGNWTWKLWNLLSSRTCDGIKRRSRRISVQLSDFDPWNQLWRWCQMLEQECVIPFKDHWNQSWLSI